MSSIFASGSEWFWDMSQVIVVAITLVMIYRQVRIQTASHVVSTLNAINRRWDSEAMLRARYLCCQHWIDGGHEFDAVAEIVGEFFEEIGTIVRTRAVPRAVIWETHSWYVEHYFYMYEKGIEGIRQKYKDPTLYSEFEWLFHQVGKTSKKKGVPHFKKTEEELILFAESEVEAANTLLLLNDDDRANMGIAIQNPQGTP